MGSSFSRKMCTWMGCEDQLVNGNVKGMVGVCWDVVLCRCRGWSRRLVNKCPSENFTGTLGKIRIIVRYSLSPSVTITPLLGRALPRDSLPGSLPSSHDS